MKSLILISTLALAVVGLGGLGGCAEENECCVLAALNACNCLSGDSVATIASSSDDKVCSAYLEGEMSVQDASEPKDFCYDGSQRGCYENALEECGL